MPTKLIMLEADIVMSRKDITVDDIRLLDKKTSQHQSKVVHAVHADEAVRIVDPKLGAIPLKAWRTSAWHLGADLRRIIPQRLQGGACWLFCTKISHQLHTELYCILFYHCQQSKSLATLAEHSQVELGSRLLGGYRTIGWAALRFADERPRDSQEETQAL